MKYYPRDPAHAIEGMQGLTLEQVGAYNLILDHIYCRDGILADDDELIRSMLHLDPRHWRRLKRELIAAGKIRITTDGRIDANGVTNTLLRTEVRSKLAQHAVNVRWKNYRNVKQNNETPVPGRNTSKRKDNKTEISTASETSGTDAVDEGENFGAPRPHSTYVTPSWAPDWTSCELDDAIKAAVKRESFATGELKKIIEDKGWKP